MTPLETIIRDTIAASGPMPFDVYMNLCLAHPQHGYYMTRDPFGAAGDFITAPEISQLFGETIALWAIDRWQQMGRPARFTLLECGPGRGTLMADLLRAAHVLPAFLAAAEVTLLEISPLLKTRQRQTLAAHPVRWIDGLAELPPQPVIMIGNEFLDAFPVKRLALSGEQHVVVRGGALAFDTEAVTGETSPASEDWMRSLCQHISQFGGAGLLIDYAYENSPDADSMQAMRRHSFVSPLDRPGECDLTAYVNYAALRQIISETCLVASPPATQRDFLLRYGLPLRLQQLLKTANPDQSAQLISGTERLLDPIGMGAQFKVLEFLKGATA